MNLKKASFAITKLTKHLKIITKMASTKPEQSVLTKEIGNKAVIILNRPNSLNALGTTIIQELADSLLKYENEKSLVILKGAGDKAFSAGGDLLEFKMWFQKGNWRKLVELVLNLNAIIYRLHIYKIPTVIFMNGITFGGGAGIASFGKYRIVTEKTLFAMPESKIAFHPNVGGTYFLNRARGKLGYYLALSGNALKGADVLQAGFATHYCLNKNLDTLEEAILNSKTQDNIGDIIDGVCEKNIPEFTLAPVMGTIDTCFAEPTVEGIFKKLEEDGSDWAKKTLESLSKYSPTSLKVILRQMQRDVLEGTRTSLISKGDTPNWKPSRLADVTEELIEKHFDLIIDEEEANKFQKFTSNPNSKI